ncbi:unnamed protein product [Linum tenue]|uniref:Smr domain-containing protein n=1 Tax=Linum tenue TaxID=586396 RepID=A0AAV0IFM7_9ROSI|nr:unnamed protein product [Linum tenue]
MQALHLNRFVSINNSPPFFSIHRTTPKPLLRCFPISSSSQLGSPNSLQSETLQALEWDSLCAQLSRFTSTSLGRGVAQRATIPIGNTPEESQKLLDQTTAAISVMDSGPLDFSQFQDITEIVDSAVSGTLLTVRELCAVRRTLIAARAVAERLTHGGDSSERSAALLEIIEDCDFQFELEQKIGFCIDCNLSTILDRASEDLEIIRSERKQNMENLDALLKAASTRVYQGGGIDKPLVTKRRSRFCVGVRASHRHLIKGGVVLDASSSGATYFMEPGDAVELNNLEVMLSNSEKEEEVAVLSLLTSEIAESEREIRYLLDCILAVDLAFARAGYSQWMNGVCPILTSEWCTAAYSGEASDSLLVDIEGIRHPLLLGTAKRDVSNIIKSKRENSSKSGEGNAVDKERFSESQPDYPVPINIKVRCGTRVVVISGPNTGGKTASMKTLGVASLMSKAGLYLPALNAPKLPWFDLVLADIGDHQSLEQSLSTFSGHISRICKILEVTSERSLVLIDEICSGTDPSEGVALSASILRYLGSRVNLAIVTTHYADLSRLKENDSRFENAAMEFCLKTLQPTYQILWGSTGDSNALSIARSIGFDSGIIERAQIWLDKLRPEMQQERRGLLYQSLVEERGRLEAQAGEAASLHAEIMEIYNELQEEAQELDKRVVDLMAQETQQVQQDVKAVKSAFQSVLQDFDNQLRTTSTEQLNALVKKAETRIASIAEANCPAPSLSGRETNMVSYTPEVGEKVHVKSLGDKLATVVEAPGDDDAVLVQYGKIKVRVNKTDIRATRVTKKSSSSSSTRRIKRQVRPMDSESAIEKPKEVYGARVQTSRNTVDLRGMRVEEAALHLSTALSAVEPQSVVFVVHGTGTGAVKQRTLEILGKHPRVSKYEPESATNFGCTVAYVK